MRLIDNIIVVIGILGGIVTGIAALPFILLLAFAFFVVMFGMWISGEPIPVKKNDDVVGYVRWFKFYGGGPNDVHRYAWINLKGSKDE